MDFYAAFKKPPNESPRPLCNFTPESQELAFYFLLLALTPYAKKHVCMNQEKGVVCQVFDISFDIGGFRPEKSSGARGDFQCERRVFLQPGSDECEMYKPDDPEPGRMYRSKVASSLRNP